MQFISMNLILFLNVNIFGPLWRNATKRRLVRMLKCVLSLLSGFFFNIGRTHCNEFYIHVYIHLQKLAIVYDIEKVVNRSLP